MACGADSKSASFLARAFRRNHCRLMSHQERRSDTNRDWLLAKTVLALTKIRPPSPRSIPLLPRSPHLLQDLSRTYQDPSSLSKTFPALIKIPASSPRPIPLLPRPVLLLQDLSRSYQAQNSITKTLLSPPQLHIYVNQKKARISGLFLLSFFQ